MTPAVNPSNESTPKIAAIAAESRARRLSDALRCAGFDCVVLFDSGNVTVETVLQARPDVVLMDLGDPDDETFAVTLTLIRGLDRATVLFVDRSDRARTNAVIEAGVGAYGPAHCLVSCMVGANGWPTATGAVGCTDSPPFVTASFRAAYSWAPIRFYPHANGW